MLDAVQSADGAIEAPERAPSEAATGATTSRSPTGSFILIGTAIFLIELLVMAALPSTLPPLADALLDSTMLVFLLTPILHRVLVVPMRQSNVERDRLIEALREKEAFSSHVLDTALGPVILIDERAIIQAYNIAAVKTFGYIASEVIGKNVNILMPEPHRSAHDGYVGRRIAGGDRGAVGMTRLVTALRRNGEQFPAELTVTEVAMKGRRYFLGVMRDITERNRAESSLLKARAELEERVSERTEQLARLVRELEERNRQTAQLAELGGLLQGCTAVGEACGAIRYSAERLFPNARGALFGFSPSRDDLETLVRWGVPDGGRTDAFPPTACWALRRGRLHEHPSLCSGQPCANRSDGQTLCLPMAAQGETLGVLHLTSDNVGSPEHVALATAMAEQAGLALANLRLRETLRLQSIVDPLTGLFNRRFMEETLTRELSRAIRCEHSLAVVVLDIDHFKRFNDTAGHDAGDSLLRGVGKFLKVHLRGSDVPCRFGGEEFVLILPEMRRGQALERADAIRRGIAELAVKHNGASIGTVTASFGVALFPEHGHDGETLIHAADQALYASKAMGRDRVTLASVGVALVAPQDDS